MRIHARAISYLPPRMKSPEIVYIYARLQSALHYFFSKHNLSSDVNELKLFHSTKRLQSNRCLA